MKPELKAAFEAQFQSREVQSQKAEQKATAEKNRKAQNLDDFGTAKKSIIRPALQEVVDMFLARQLPARIEERDEQQTNRDGGISDPYIRLSLEPVAHSYSTLREEFTLFFNKDKREVLLHTSTRSQSGPGPRCKLEEVSAEWIQSEFLTYESRR